MNLTDNRSNFSPKVPFLISVIVILKKFSTRLIICRQFEKNSCDTKIRIENSRWIAVKMHLHLRVTPVSASKVHRSREWTRAPSSSARVIATKTRAWQQGEWRVFQPAGGTRDVTLLPTPMLRPSHSLSIHTPLSPPPPTSRFSHYRDTAGIHAHAAYMHAHTVVRGTRHVSGP